MIASKLIQFFVPILFLCLLTSHDTFLSPPIHMSNSLFDVIIIPGGGLEPQTNLPQPWVRARLDHALTLLSQTRFLFPLSYGTTHRPPPLDSRGFPITESAASAAYLVKRGVAVDRILLDTWSLDTIGNAWFARVNVCDKLQLIKCCIVTSAFHMERTKAIFEWVFAMDGGQYQLHFVQTENTGMSEDQVRARVDKEISSLQTLRNTTMSRVTSLQELVNFLLINHTAYNVKGVIDKADNSANHKQDERLTSTY